jgi:hypothetical protein
VPRADSVRKPASAARSRVAWISALLPMPARPSTIASVASPSIAAPTSASSAASSRSRSSSEAVLPLPASGCVSIGGHRMRVAGRR